MLEYILFEDNCILKSCAFQAVTLFWLGAALPMHCCWIFWFTGVKSRGIAANRPQYVSSDLSTAKSFF